MHTAPAGCILCASIVTTDTDRRQTERLTRKPLPLYHQLKELLLQRIESGEWAPGDQLPTEAEFSAQFGVSRVTVRQALQLLVNQGLVERRQGLGTFVGRPKVAHNLQWMYRDGKEIADQGGVIRYELHHLTRKPATQALARHLGIAADETVYETQRTLIADDEPLMIISSWLPMSLFNDLESKDFGKRTMMTILAEYGMTASHQHKEVEITILDEEEAALLGVDPGAPALLLTYLNYLPDGRPFEYRRTLVRGDRCKYYIDVDRPELVF
jgi:GntR family transcriptional regulator